MIALPTGRRGQVLAVAMLLLLVGLVWLSAVTPAIDWYRDRAETLSQQQTLAARMASVAATAPALQSEIARSGGAPAAAITLLPGATDAIAGSALQQAVQDMAGRAGATIGSAEVLPAETIGGYRRIGLHVTVSGSWPVVIAMLRAVAEATPRMLVDDVALRPALALNQSDTHPLEASFTVIAFHAPVAP